VPFERLYINQVWIYFIIKSHNLFFGKNKLKRNIFNVKDKSKIEESRLILRHADEHWSVTTIVGFVCYLQLEDGAMTTA